MSRARIGRIDRNGGLGRRDVQVQRQAVAVPGQRVGVAADRHGFAGRKRAELDSVRIHHGDRGIETRGPFRQRIRAVSFRPGDREREERSPPDDGKIVDQRSRAGRAACDVEIEDRAVGCGDDRAVRKVHLSGQFAAGVNTDLAAGIDRDVARHAAILDEHSTVGFDRVAVRHAFAVDIDAA